MQQAKGSLYLQLNRPWYIDCASIILSIIGSLFLRELCWNNHISNFNGNNRLVCKRLQAGNTLHVILLLCHYITLCANVYTEKFQFHYSVAILYLWNAKTGHNAGIV